jgi:hypothetical protein
MENNNQKYIYERILTIKDRLKNIDETMELVYSDIKFIEELLVIKQNI